MPDMNEKPTSGKNTHAVIACAICLILVAGYFGSDALLLDHCTGYVYLKTLPDGRVVEEHGEAYKFGDEHAVTFFWPAARLYRFIDRDD